MSPQTVYAAFGSKAGVLAELVENLITSVRQDEAPIGIMTAEDLLRLCARMARRIYDALRDVLRFTDNLRGDLIDVARAPEEARFASLTGAIETLAASGRLERFPDVRVAHDLLWSLTGPDMYRRLVIERRWSPDCYEAELGELLIRTLIA